MNVQERAEVAKAIKRDADTLADLATTSLGQEWLPRFPIPTQQESGSGLSGHRHGTPSVEDVTSMLRAGFVRFGDVVAVSVVADEPGLIVNDIAWLIQMFKARGIAFASDSWVAEMMRAYADACGDIFPESSCVLIRANIERALEMVGNLDLR